MELYFVISIVERERVDEMLEIHHSLPVSLVTVNLGSGTATEEHLSLYDLEVSEKAIFGTVADVSTMRQLIRTAKRQMHIDIPGNGIMMAVPMRHVGGGRALAYLTEGQTPGTTMPKMEFSHELIYVVLNEGCADAVMDIAREAGATGGTVLHGRGAGKKRSEKFHGISLAEEKDMIYILADVEKKSDIMRAIALKAGFDTPACAICFSMPVSEVAGLRKFD